MKSIELIAKCIQKFAPKEIAEDWDNTGILIDRIVENNKHRILLTIDLTEDVLEEAINLEVSDIVCYHPIIFESLKSIKNKIIIQCISHNIAVYSPHTQLDPLMNRYYNNIIGFQPQTFDEIVEKLKCVSGISKFRVVRAKNALNYYEIDKNIKIGVGAAFRRVNYENCLLITGEMGHHDLLKCKFSKVDVILMEHSNSERIFLAELKRLLENDFELSHFEILISSKDSDPISIV